MVWLLGITDEKRLDKHSQTKEMMVWCPSSAPTVQTLIPGRLPLKITRREFLRTSIGTSALLLSGDPSVLSQITDRAPLPKRLLGKTGERVSAVGFGGIVVMNATDEQARLAVEDAVARGVNYFDVAPSYGDAEQRLGPALAPYRDQVFLACKTTKRDRGGAEEELTASLSRLKTDHVDLYQMHAISDVEKDVKRALAAHGAIQAFESARKAGKVRYLGFSAHTPQAALAAMKAFDFDTIMYPVNFVCHFDSSFEVEVLAEAKKRKMGIIAIKAIAKQKRQEGAPRKYPKCWYEPIDDPELARLALGWSLAQGISVAIPPGEEELFRLASEAALQAKAPTEEEIVQLREIASGLDPIFRA